MSHKFTVEIELKDARYCEWCPYLGHWRCKRFNVALNMEGEGNMKPYDYTYVLHTIRPQICIDAEKDVDMPHQSCNHEWHEHTSETTAPLSYRQCSKCGLCEFNNAVDLITELKKGGE